MACDFFKEEAGRINAVLTFKRSELLYEVKNCSFIEGTVMETQSEHNRHTVQDVGEEGNVDRITRMLDLAVAKCKEMMYPFTKTQVEELAAFDNKLREREVYGIVLSLPSGFSRTSLAYLEKLIHEFVVDRAMSEWMKLTNPSKVRLWEERQERSEVEIKAALMSRRTHLRRKQSPF